MTVAGAPWGPGIAGMMVSYGVGVMVPAEPSPFLPPDLSPPLMPEPPFPVDRDWMERVAHDTERRELAESIARADAVARLRELAKAAWLANPADPNADLLREAAMLLERAQKLLA